MSAFGATFRSAVVGAVEAVSLLGALFFTLPPLPSDESAIPFLPLAILASVLFAISRGIRHAIVTPNWRSVVLWLLEVSGFVAFAYLNNEIANTLLGKV